MCIRDRYYTSAFDLTNHYEGEYLIIEKFDERKVWSAVFFDAEQQYYYLKRFRFEETTKILSFIGEGAGSCLVGLSCARHPQFEILFGGKYANRPAELCIRDRCN